MTRSRAAIALATVAVAFTSCGGETGQAVQDGAERQSRKSIDRAVDSARKSGRRAALKEIDRLERQAKVELERNGAKRIEQAADLAREEVRRRAR